MPSDVTPAMKDGFKVKFQNIQLGFLTVLILEDCNFCQKFLKYLGHNCASIVWLVLNKKFTVVNNILAKIDCNTVCITQPDFR